MKPELQGILRIKILTSNNERYIQILRESGIQIGDGCIIDKTAEFGTEPYLISLGNNVRITKGVSFITHDGGLWVARNLGLVKMNADKFGRVRVGDNVNIGWNAIIMPGVTIGNNVIVGCGAIVTKDVPDNSIVAGVPAKVIESIEEYTKKNSSRCVPTKGMSGDDKKKYLLEKLES